MTTWTIDQMLARNPCPEYDQARITALWAGRETITTREILALDIPAEDRIWAALQDATIAARVVERIVTRAVTTYTRTCGVPVAEAWAARWLSGEDRTRAAAEATRAAAWGAAGAAWAAEAAWAAAGATRAAAWGAAWAAEAAWAAQAAGAAERDRQLADIRAVLDEDDHG